jgi:hypothetical protein
MRGAHGGRYFEDDIDEISELLDVCRWIFLVMSVAVGTDDKGKTASTEK